MNLITSAVLALSSLVTGSQTLGQTASVQPPAVPQMVYAVAAIKPHAKGDDNTSIHNNPDGFECRNVNLKMLIANAYGVPMDRLFGGPSWIGNTTWDITAKVAGEDVAAYKMLKPDQRDVLLRQLLRDRFQVMVHRETKVIPTLDLVVYKSGLKLKPLPDWVPPPEAATDASHARRPHSITTNDLDIHAEAITMQDLANTLSSYVEKTVFDKTGEKGEYNLDLKWQPDEEQEGMSIYAAVPEQLGLKLIPGKGPVEVLVIDRVEQPTPN